MSPAKTRPTKRSTNSAPTPTPTSDVVALIPAQPAPPTAALSVLERAIASGASVDVLERLLGLQERWEQTQARKAFNAALAAVREHLPSIVKNREVDFQSDKGRTHYAYEDLDAVVKAVSPVLACEGLSFRWRTDSTTPDLVKVTCIVSHRDGYSEENTLSSPVDRSGNKNAIQAVGSAVTYLQRYTLKAALGVAAAHDDDGRSSGEPAATAPPLAHPDDPIQPPNQRKLSPKMAHLWATIKSSGRSESEIKAWLAVTYDIDSTKKILHKDFRDIVSAIERPGPLPDPTRSRVPGEDDE